jgi:hypothetical protein
VQTAVKTIAFAVVGKLDNSTKEDLIAYLLFSHLVGGAKEFRRILGRKRE